MTTLRDVASLAGVSTATVSNALNGKGRVSAKLQRRVLAAVQELNYQPDQLARSLRVRRSMAIGVVISDISQPHFATAIRAIEEVARLRGYTVVVGDSNENADQEAACIRVLRSRRVDGFIVVPAASPHPELTQLAQGDVPLVFMDRELAELPVSCALMDNELAAYSAVRHLIEHGHRRIGLIGTKPGLSPSRDRQAGFVRALRDADIVFDERLVAMGGLVAAGGAEAMRALISLDEPPTAVFVAGHHVTMGAIAAIQGARLNVPDDIALVGYGDSPWCELVRPTLTTVDRPSYELGRVSAALLFDEIESGRSSQVKRVLLRCELVIRESCGVHVTDEPVRVDPTPVAAPRIDDGRMRTNRGKRITTSAT